MVKKAFIMTRLPHVGLNKKRLSREIGYLRTKRFILNNIENYKKIFLTRNDWELNYYITKKETFRSFTFSHNKGFIIQNGGDLGEKIWNLKKIVSSPFILFGNDIPDISISSIKLSFECLKKSEIVIGPSIDGGFWLIGFANKKIIPFPFSNIRWSSSNTLKDLLFNLNRHRIKFSLTEKLRDIDILDDYCDYVSS